MRILASTIQLLGEKRGRSDVEEGSPESSDRASKAATPAAQVHEGARALMCEGLALARALPLIDARPHVHARIPSVCTCADCTCAAGSLTRYVLDGWCVWGELGLGAGLNLFRREQCRQGA